MSDNSQTPRGEHFDGRNIKTFAVALSSVSVVSILSLATVAIVVAVSGGSNDPQSVALLPQSVEPPVAQRPDQRGAALEGGSSQQSAATQPSQQQIIGQQPPRIAQSQDSSSVVAQQQPVVTPQRPSINALLATPEPAGAILDLVGQAPAIEVPGDIDNGRPIFAFFDPRCPYCHQAYAALSGQYRIAWLPTLALGQQEQGEPLMAGLLGPTEAAVEAGAITAVTLQEDADRLTRLDNVMRGQRIEPGEMSDSQRFAINQNLTIAMQLYELHSQPLGVPTFIVPKPDGTAVFIRGWDATDTPAEIEAAYGSGSSAAPEAADG